MRPIVFAGPSIDAHAARSILPSADLRGPAQCGDIWRATEEGAHFIGLCDGFFEHCLPVWHKEILWALSRGARVYGAASMGALRAAELEHFGMIGTGRIFEQYRDGLLEDDDEVAILHEPAAHDYRPKSESLVNIRATLERAIDQAVISPDAAAALVSLGKSMFYADRTYDSILGKAAAEAAWHYDVVRLREWLATHGSIDQKQLDAEAMLKIMRSDLESIGTRRVGKVRFQFAHTDAWDAFRQTFASKSPRPNLATGGRTLLRHHGTPMPLSSPAVHDEGSERALALALGDAAGFAPDAAAVQRRSEAFRHAKGLLDPEKTTRWLAARGLDIEGFSRLIYEELVIERFREHARNLAADQTHRLLQLLDGSQ